MKIIIGPDAPTLSEQGFGDLINCERYQFLLDTLIELAEEGNLNEDEFEFQVQAIVSNIVADIEDIVKTHAVLPLEQCIYVNTDSSVVH